MLVTVPGVGSSLAADCIKEVFYVQLKVARLVIVVLAFSILEHSQASLPEWNDIYPRPSNCSGVLDIIEGKLGGGENYSIDIFSPSNELRHWTFCVIRDRNADTCVIIKIFENFTLEEAGEVLSGGNVTINGQPYILGADEKEQLFKFLEGFYNSHMGRLSKGK